MKNIRKFITVLFSIIAFLLIINTNTLTVHASSPTYGSSSTGKSVATGDSGRGGKTYSCNFWSTWECKNVSSKTVTSSFTWEYKGGTASFKYLANDCGNVKAYGTVVFSMSGQSSKTVVSSYRAECNNTWKDASFTLPATGTWTVTFTCKYTGSCSSGEDCGFWVRGLSQTTPSYTYTINFNANGGSGTPDSISATGTDTSTVMGDIGSTVPTRSGYIFRGWSASSSYSNSYRIAYSSNYGGGTDKNGYSATTTSSTWTYANYCSYTGGSSSSTTLTLYAQWESSSVSYTVYHYKQNLDGTYPSSATSTSTGTTTIGSSLTPSVNSYTGFTSPSTQTITVASSGNTVSYYYTRNSYTLTVNPNSGTWNSTTSNSTYTLKYEETKTISNPTRSGYIFNGWTVSGTNSSLSGTTFTMGSANTTLTANWTQYTYTISFDANGGSGAPSSITASGASTSVVMGNIPSTVPTRDGYVFRGWSATSSYDTQKRIAYSTSAGGEADNNGNSAIITESTWTYGNYCSVTGGSTSSRTLTLYAQWEENSANYTVYHFLQDIQEDENIIPGYTLKETQNLTGAIGTSVTPEVKSYTGFFSPSAETVTIEADGSTSVYYYYLRYNCLLSIDPNGGIYDNETSSSILFVQYEESKEIDNPTRAGYTFSGWTLSGEGSSMSGTTFTMGATTACLTANWVANTNTAYTVKHWQQNLDGTASSMDDTNYTLIDTDNLTGTTDSSITPSVKNYEGFTSPVTQTVTISPDGSLIVNYYYTRNSYTVTYKDTVDSIFGTELGSTTASKLYGATVMGSELGSDKTANAYYDGYTYVSNTFATVGTNGATVYRVFQLALAEYQINHYKQDIEGNYSSTPDETENYEGTVGSFITPDVKDYVGFTSPETQTVEITADGSTVVDYYYTRNSYEVTYVDVIDSASGDVLGSTTILKPYDSNVYGSDLGNDTEDNAYYNGYYYVSDSSSVVSTSGATVYRIFKLRTIDISGTANWADKNNQYNSRPDSVNVYLLKDGTQIDSVSGLTENNENEFSFTDLPKYSTTTGEEIVYTIEQSKVTSKNAPEDKYVASITGDVTSGYVVTNTLKNNVSDKEDSDDEETGFTVKGSISWDDDDDKLGYRPENVIINLYMDGKLLKTITKDKDVSSYIFTNLERYIYNDDGTVKETHVYQIQEVLSPTPSYIVDGEAKEAYTVAYSIPDIDTKNGSGTISITNTFNNAEGIISVKPYNNSLTIKTNCEDYAEISLKKMDASYVDNEVIYKDTYSDIYYNLMVNNIAETISHMVAGKYEVNTVSSNFSLENVELADNEFVSLVKENDKYYIIIEETSSDAYGSITINLTEKDHVGYQTGADIMDFATYGANNYWLVTLSEISTETTKAKMSRKITVPIIEKSSTVETTETEASEEKVSETEISEEETTEVVETSEETEIKEKEKSKTSEESASLEETELSETAKL